MSIGTGIVLFVIGAVITFGVGVDVWGPVNLDLIGYIFMGAGLVVFIIGMIAMFRKRQTVTTVKSDVNPANGSGMTQRTTSDTNDAPMM